MKVKTIINMIIDRTINDAGELSLHGSPNVSGINSDYELLKECHVITTNERVKWTRKAIHIAHIVDSYSNHQYIHSKIKYTLDDFTAKLMKLKERKQNYGE